MIDLSIVIVNWNTRELLVRCLGSIQRFGGSGGQERGLRCETLVVDNGSEDGSAEAVARHFPWAELLEVGANLGFAAACNLGLRRARGRTALLLNSDTELTPGVLVRCVRYLEEHPDVGILGPRLVSPDGREQNAVHGHPGLLSELLPPGLLCRLLPGRFPSRHRGFCGPTEVPAVLGAALFVRRSLLEEVGLLPEDHFLFLEETDLCLRAARAGWRILHLPEVCVVHVHGASSKRPWPAETRIEYQRSLDRFLRKHRGPGLAQLAGLWRMAKTGFYVSLRAPAALLFRPIRRRWRQDCRVLAWYLRGRPEDWGIPGRRPAAGGDPAPRLGGVL